MASRNLKSASGAVRSVHSVSRSVRGGLYEDVPDATYITIPPDGGWGWVVVLASFICNMIVDGATYAFGIFLDDISSSYGVEPTTIALVTSLVTGFCFLFGPLACSLVNRYGFRVVGLAGGIITSVAFLVSPFVTSVAAFVVILGGGAGFGTCLIYVPSIVVIGFYFERWRAFATSLAVTGSGVGIVLMPVIMQGLLSELNWIHKFKIISGAFVLVGLLTLLYRPVKPVKVVSDDAKKLDYINTDYDNESFASLSDDGASSSTVFRKFYSQFKGKTNTAFPTTSEVIRSPKVMHHSGSSASSMFLSSTAAAGSISTILKSTTSKQTDDDKLSTVYEIESKELGKGCLCCIKCRKCWRKCCCKCYNHCLGPKYANRPMYRDDIFYGASLATMPLYSQSVQTTKSVTKGAPSTVGPSAPSTRLHTLEYHMSVSRVMTQRDLEEQGRCCKCCPEAVVRPLATMMDCSLLKSPSFLLLAFSGFCTTFGMYIPFIYIEHKAREAKVAKEYCSYLLVVMGVSNMLGRFFSGLISSIPKINSLLFSYVSLTICGIVTMLSYFLKDASGHFAYSAIFGFTIACLSSLRAPIVVDLIGLDKLTNGFGILLMFQGIAALCGTTISSVLANATHSYRTCFLFAGSCLLISGLMLIPIKRISNWEKSRE